MLTLYCDESDDGETYALAGWLATPTGGSDPAWRAMLQTLTYGRGRPMYPSLLFGSIPVWFANQRTDPSYLRGTTGLRSSCSCPIPPQTISRSLRE